MITVLTGSNDFLLKQALERIRMEFVNKYTVHALEQLDGGEVEPTMLREMLTNVSLFAPSRLVVIRDLAANKQAWEALGELLEQVPESVHLLLVEPAPDKRTKTFKSLQKLADVQTFEPLHEGQLAQWLQQAAKEGGGDLQPQLAQYLVARAGTDQWRLWQELQKLLSYSPHISQETIKLLVEPNPQASVFELLDAAFARQPKRIQHLLQPIMASEDPYKFMGLLIAQVQAVAIVKSAGGRSADSIAQEAGLHPFVVRKTQALVRTLSAAQLQAYIAAAVVCDEQLKSTGVEPWTILAQCLMKIAVA